jgi:hypothetical protein
MGAQPRLAGAVQRRAVVCGNNTGPRARFGWLLAAIALAGCAAGEEVPSRDQERTAESMQEIKGGYPDPRDRAVAGVLILDRRGHVSRTCSSTLIAPNLVLTAQHCIADAPKFIACKTATFGQPVDPAQVYVTAGDALWSANAPWIAAREVLRPPDGNAVCGRDIALVVLASPMRSSEVTPLDPRLDRPPEASEIYSAVGFGDTESRARDGGARRRRDGLLVECVGYSCGTQERVASSEWRGDTGICSGDSGGPALDNAGRVMGVTSRGPTGCADPIYGGLIAHRGWLVAEASRAADAGGYDTPAWAATSEGAGVLPWRRPIDDRWTSCSNRPGDGNATSGETTALTLIALLGLSRIRGSRRRA